MPPKLSPAITKNAVCLFVSDTAYETRYTVAYFEEAKEETLNINVGHFYGSKPVKRDFTITFDGKATKKLMRLLGKDKQSFLKELQKRFSGFSSQDKLVDFAEQKGIAFEVEDTLKMNDLTFRHEFEDVLASDPQLYDMQGNYIVPKLYNPPQNGVVKIYTKDKFLLFEFPYKNGKKHGHAKCYKPGTKILQWEQFYSDGKLDGEAKSYYKNGRISATCTFVKGVKQGPERLYHKDGYLEEETMWAKNRENGPAKKFFPNGQVKLEANFVDGLQEGITREYDKDGNLIFESTFNKGETHEKNSHKNGKFEHVYEYGEADSYQYKEIESIKNQEKVVIRNPFRIKYSVDLKKQTLRLTFIQGKKRCEADIDCRTICIDYLAEDFDTMDLDNEYGIIGTRYLPECSGKDLVLSIAYTYGSKKEETGYHVDISSRYWKKGEAKFIDRDCFYANDWSPITKELAHVFQEIAQKYPSLGRPLKEFKEEQERETKKRLDEIEAYIMSNKNKKPKGKAF